MRAERVFGGMVGRKGREVGVFDWMPVRMEATGWTKPLVTGYWLLVTGRRVGTSRGGEEETDTVAAATPELLPVSC